MTDKQPDTIYSALLKVQKALKPAKRNQQNEDFAWADLASVIATVRPLLLRHGILTLQHPDGEMVGSVFMAAVDTTLFHVASETAVLATAECPCAPTSRDYAAAVTVLRRVGLASLVGLVQEDEALAFGIGVNGTNRAHDLIESKRKAAEGPF